MRILKSMTLFMSDKCMLDVCCSFKVWKRTQSHSPHWLNQKRGRIGQSSYTRETKDVWLPRLLDSRALTAEEQALFLSGHWFSWVAYLLMIGSFIKYVVGCVEMFAALRLCLSCCQISEWHSHLIHLPDLRLHRLDPGIHTMWRRDAVWWYHEITLECPELINML